MNENYCQSCGMPMGTTDEMYGTNADGSKSTDYCSYCYDKGTFTSESTMEEMIDFCAGPMVEHNPNMTVEEAKNAMRGFFPSLKRWKTA